MPRFCISCPKERPKRASFGVAGGEPVSCKLHIQPDFVDVVTKRCETEGCPVINPAFGPEGGSGRKCKKHAEPGWVDVRHERCDYPLGCNHRPTFAPRGKAARRCAVHKEPDWVDVRSKRCDHPSGCNHQPTFAPRGKAARRCAVHKEPGWVDVISAKCRTCGIKAKYGLRGGPKLSCVKHIQPGYIDLTRAECKNAPLCPGYVNNKEHKGCCFRCFCNEFPGEIRARSYKAKEHQVSSYVRELLDSHKALVNVSELARFDKRVDGGCSLRRPDIMLDCLTHVVVQETDEHQHNGYDCSCEDKKMMELFQDVGHRPIVFVRFNPDAYKAINGNRVPSCFVYHEKFGLPMVPTVRKAAWQQRLQVLAKRLIHHVQTVPEREVTIEHLFYNSFHAL